MNQHENQNSATDMTSASHTLYKIAYRIRYQSSRGQKLEGTRISLSADKRV
jgi:hypothetical protein